MAGAIAVLRDLHRLRRLVTKLQEEIDRGPRQIKARHGVVARQEETVKQAHDLVSKLKVANRDRESQLKQAHQQVAKWLEQQKTIHNKKEYDALAHEIAGGKARVEQLENEILEGMTTTEEEQAKLPGLDRALQDAKDELPRFEKATRDRAAVLTEELKRATEELKATEEQLPDSIRSEYERLVALKGEDALSLVVNGNCSACYTALREQLINDLRSGRLVLCRACDRIVYLAEEAYA